jgi:2',3'-cyclic-nucleotide 2'-phosphodiesterase (5'-nucleotidase family)
MLSKGNPIIELLTEGDFGILALGNFEIYQGFSL